MKHVLIASLVFTFALLGCKSTGGYNSSLANENGWGPIILPGGKLKCKEEKLEDVRLDRYRSYIREHLKIIAKANPATFRDELAIKKFCIVPIVSSEIDAAGSLDGSLFIHSGVLRAAETDAQFAGLLAHVLAHITLRHDAIDMAEFVDFHREYQEEYFQLNLARQEIERFDIQYVVPERDWNRYLETTRNLVRKKFNAARAAGNQVAMNGLECDTIGAWDKIGPTRAEVLKRLPNKDYEKSLCHQFFQELNIEHKQASLLWSWKEIEADKVAYEFFLRAAYPKDEYAQFFENVTHLGGQAKSKCLTHDAGKEDDRPQDCWRSANIRAELRAHAADKALKLDAVTLHPFGDKLNQLRAEFVK